MDKIIAAIENISIGKPIGWIMLIFIIVTSIFEFSPKIKVNPISAIFRWIGDKTNGKLMSEVKELRSEIAEIKEKQEKTDAESKEDRAELRRVRILCFGDELRRKERHSKESFDQVLKDITDYNNYCDTHKDFQNEMTVATAEIIEEQYKVCFRENSFL